MYSIETLWTDSGNTSRQAVAIETNFDIYIMKTIKGLLALYRLKMIRGINEERKEALIFSIGVFQRYKNIQSNYGVLIKPPFSYPLPMTCTDCEKFVLKDVGKKIIISEGYAYELIKTKI